MADKLSPDEMRQIIETVINAAKELDNLAQSGKDASEEADKNSKALATFGKNLLNASGQFAKASINVSDTAGKYSGSIEAVGSATKEFTSKMGLLGQSVGFVVDLFAKFTGGVLRQNEQLVKTYRSLSQVGEIGTTSFKELGEKLQNAGYSIDQNAEAYANVIKKVAPGLAVFGGTVSDGVKALQDNYNVVKLNEKQMQRYGMSQDEMFERTATYMSVLSTSGNVQKRTTESVSKESAKYLEVLSQMAMLTGQQRDELEAQMLKDQNDLRYQLYLEGLDEDARLKVRAIMMDMPETLRDGAKSILVNQGNVYDDFAAQFKMALGNKGIQAMMDVVNDKTTGAAIAVGRMQKTHSEILDKQMKTFRPIINTTSEGIKELGLTADTNAYRMRGRAYDERKMQERIDKLRTDGENKDMDANTKRVQRERTLRNAFEDLEMEMSEVILPLLDSFSIALEAIGSTMADLAFWFSRGSIDVRDAFVKITSMADATQEVAKQTKKQIELGKEEEKLKKQLLDPLRTDKDKERIREELAGVQTRKSASQRALQRATKQGTQFSQQAMEERREGAGEQQVKGPGGGKLDLVTVRSKSGQSAQVAKEYAASFQGLIDYLDQSGYKINSLGGYSDRANTSDPSKKSIHAFGGAIDINPESNPYGSKLITDMPQNIGAVAAALGLGWGGNWNSVKDAMHFSAARSEGGSLLEARNGGIFKGSVKGYNVKLHKDEAVVPLNKGVTKQPLSSMPQFSDNREVMEIFTSIYDKLDTLVDLTRRTASTQDEMLTYAKQA